MFIEKNMLPVTLNEVKTKMTKSQCLIKYVRICESWRLFGVEYKMLLTLKIDR